VSKITKGKITLSFASPEKEKYFFNICDVITSPEKEKSSANHYSELVSGAIIGRLAPLLASQGVES